MQCFIIDSITFINDDDRCVKAHFCMYLAENTKESFRRIKANMET